MLLTKPLFYHNLVMLSIVLVIILLTLTVVVQLRKTVITFSY